MPTNRNQKTSCSNNNTKSHNNNIKSYNNNNNIQQFSAIPEEDPEWDKYYGRHPSNRVLGHLISVEDYKKIQGAYDKSTLGKLKRLQAKKKSREKLEALATAAAAAAVSKLLKPESAEVATSPEISAEAPAPELHSAKGVTGEAAPLDLQAGGAAPLDHTAGGAAPLDFPAGDAAPLDLPAGNAALLDLPAGDAAQLDLAVRETAPLDLAAVKAAPFDLPAGEAAPLDLPAGDAALLGLPAGNAAPLDLPAGYAALLDLPAGETAPLDLPAGDAAPLDFTAGDATPEDLAAAIDEARRLMGIGPMPFQGYANGCLDWMPQTETAKASVPTVKPQMKPIGYEMLEKKQKLAQLTGGLDRKRLDAEYDVLRTAIQMDAKDLVNMSPKDLERAIIDTGLEISELAYGPPELPNWMCQAILSILDKPAEPKRIWEAASVLPDPSPDFSPPFSGSQIRAEVERAMAQVPERPLYPIAQYPGQEPTSAGAQMPPTYDNIQMPTTYETFQVAPTYEAVQMPPTYDFAPMYDPQYQQVPPQEAQIQTQSNLPSASGGNRRVPNNHIRGRTYYRGGKGRVGQTQRHQNCQQYRQQENNTNNNTSTNNNINNYDDRYNTYNQQPQYFQDINSIMIPPNQLAAVEPRHDMMPVGNPPAQNYGQYQNMPYAPMGYQNCPGPQTGHQPVANQAANFVAPPSINQFNNNNHNNNNHTNNNNHYNYYNDNNQNNNYAPIMPPPMNLNPNPNPNPNPNSNPNPNFQTNANVNNNLQQLQPQQQKFKRAGNKFSTWGAPNSQEFIQFVQSGEPGGALRMASSHPTPYAPTYGVNMPLQVPCAPDNEYDLTLSDSNFPPLPDPLKTRQEKGKSSTNYM